MKTNEQRASYGLSPKQTLQIVHSFFTPLRPLVATLIFCAASASAAPLTWDAGNTNNGATIDSASGFWDVTHLTTNLTTTTTTTNNANLGAGGIDWFQVNVPADARAATNILLYATNLPVNVWFSTTQTTNNAGDTLLMSGVTSGVSVLTTISVPNIVQGGTYYIGIDNSANNVAVGYALEVDLSLADPVTSTLLNWNNGTGNVSWTQGGTTTPLNGATFNGPDAAAGTYQVAVDGGQVSATNLTINANGYVFSGSPIFLNGNGNHYNFFVADGKNVVISNNITGSGNVEYVLGVNGAPSSATFFGTLNSFTPYWTSTNGSIFYLAGGGGASIGAINADVRLTNGTYNSGSAFVIARNTSPSFPNANSGSFTADGPATILNQNSDYIYLGRQGTAWNATLNIQNGATVNYQTGAANNNLGLGLPRPGSTGANCKSVFNMYGGTLNMGPGTETTGAGGGPNPRPIFLENSGSSAGQLAIMNQTGGVINAWGGILIGGSTGSGSSFVTNSGGFLYIGSIGNNGIKVGTSATATNIITLSGGTVGALQSWISSAPMTLATLNGNITFQCADASATPFNIGLSGALTGPGGLNKTGGGQLTLSGVNSYAGSTVVSNGFLQLVTSAVSSTNGALTVDGSAGTPTVSVKVSNQGQNWQIGTLTTVNNGTATPTLDFQHAGIIPSGSVGAIQVAGNVNYTVTPIVSVTNDTALPVGKFPLITYTGGISGTPPTVPILPTSGYCLGYLSNSAAAKTLFLVITQSTYVPAIVWADSNGAWDFTSPNWTGPGNKYVDGDGVGFDDTAAGSSPLAISLNTTVNPLSVTFNNAAKNYSFAGTGNITGGGSLSVLNGSGGGTISLSTPNTYSGGTTITGPGRLNINYGGTGGSDSAIGTGTLNLNTGAKLDNTSGHDVTLNTATPIPINWNDDWTFVGTTNLNLGLGQVTMFNVEVQLTVVSNTLTVNNPIAESGGSFKLTKLGAGTLTLSNASSTFSGGVDLEAGTLNINSDGSVGSGPMILGGGALDNTSGADVSLSASISISMLANFTFKGSGNLNLGPGPVTIGNNTITLNGTNALETDGAFLGGNRNTIVTGTGKWIIGGNGANQNLGLTVNGGTVYYSKQSGFAQGNPFTINTSGSVVMLNPNGAQINAGVGVTLAGGLLDLNGDSEPIGTVTFNSGILRNSAPGTAAALPTAAVTLGNAGCVFDVPAVDSSLTVASASGSGGLILNGLGLVNISSNGYAGNTTISNGTLVLIFPTLGTNSTVLVNTNASLGTNGVLTLNFANSETNTVAALILGGVSKPAGIYSAATDPRYLAGSGSLQVVPLINSLPGPIQFNVSGSALALSWPTNLGWILQSETNLSSNAWFDVANSGSVTSTNITINPATSSLFFRLRHP